MKCHTIVSHQNQPKGNHLKHQYPKASHPSVKLMATRKFFPFPQSHCLPSFSSPGNHMCILSSDPRRGGTTSPYCCTQGIRFSWTVTPVGTASAAATSAATPDHTLSFFMHDILGGSNPLARAVTGMVVNPALSGQVPFAKPNGAVLPVNNGVPVNNANSGVINNNNIPFLTGIGGTTSNVMQNNGNNIIRGGFGFPVLNSAQIPAGATLQKLMFGTMTVFDDELTEGHELGSGLIGKSQGFYIASSEDGSSQTMVFNVVFTSDGYVDSLNFFGVHRMAVSESHLAIMGGTGKYVNAKGYATVKAVPGAANQHNTDGVETVLEITVYLTY